MNAVSSSIPIHAAGPVKIKREEGWVNDLNGLIYYEGEYHFFAQRRAKCWLHTVSKDI